MALGSIRVRSDSSSGSGGGLRFTPGGMTVQMPAGYTPSEVQAQRGTYESQQKANAQRDAANRTLGSSDHAKWANSLALSAYMPELASGRAGLEAGMEDARLQGIESRYRASAAQSDADLTKRRIQAGLGADQDAYARAREKNAVDVAGIGIDEGYLARQKQYNDQMLGLTNRDIDLRQDTANLDLGAVERQFPLLQKEREDITTLQTNLLGDIAARDKAASDDERIKQLDMISQAAAQGSAGAAVPTEHAKALATQLQEELAGNERRRIEANTNYQAALRKNDENMAQARDAKEKIRIEKERIELERQRAAAEAAEAEQRRQEDEQRKALERFYAAIALQQAADQLKAAQTQAFFAAAAAQQQAQQQAFYAGLQQQQQQAMQQKMIQDAMIAEAMIREKARRDAEAYAASRAVQPTQYGSASQTAMRQGRVAGVR